jgi:hypothetical protein
MASNDMMAGGTSSAQPLKAPIGNDDEMIAWANHKKRVGRAAVSDYQFRLNLAFVLSYQWVSWDVQKRAFAMPKTTLTDDPNAVVRLTANKIAPALERWVAKMTKNLPEPQCRPVSDNDDDLGASKVGTRLMASELNRLQWEAWIKQFLFKVGTYGMSYAHLYWDPTLGDAVGKNPNPDKDADDDTLFEGNIVLEQVPAYELWVAPSAQDMRKARWAGRTTTMLREDVWERWGVELPGGTATRTIAQEVMALGNESHTEQAVGEWVEVHQLWMLPSKAAPKGFVLTWSGQKVLEYKGKYPYDHGVLPFEQCDMLPGIVGRDGRTWVSDLIPLQIDYNDTLSRAATIRRQLVPKWIGPVGSIDPSRVTNRVEVMLYRQVGEKPELMMPNAGWAQGFNEGMERDEQDMMDRAGINDASSGKAASTAPAASIMALQEADDTRLSVSVASLSKFISGVGWQILMLARQFWDEERTVRTWSDENVLEVERYLGSDIDEQLDVHVDAESGLPKSKAAQIEMVMQLAKMYPHDIGIQDVVRMLELPGFDFTIRTQDAQTRKQWREIGQMIAGVPCQVEPFDNHQISLNVLNQFRSSREYELLAPEIKALIDAHAAIHESLVLHQMGIAVPTPEQTQSPEALAQGQRAQAGPGGQGGQPGPGTQQPQQGTPPQTPSTQQLGGFGQGAAGQPGAVPGVSPDQQAASMGN